MIVIRSRTEGFRRCGVAHSIAPTQHPDDRFTDDELERLLKEPMLTVEVLPNDTANDDEKSSDAEDDAAAPGRSIATDSSASDKKDAVKPAGKKAGSK